MSEEEGPQHMISGTEPGESYRRCELEDGSWSYVLAGGLGSGCLWKWQRDNDVIFWGHWFSIITVIALKVEMLMGIFMGSRMD